MTEELYNKLERMFQRNERKAAHYQHKYSGKEEDHTFHGGWNLGYWEGRTSALEEVLDILSEFGMKPKIDILTILKRYNK